MEWKTIALTAFMISLCFLAIPIRIGPDTSDEDVKLFEAYIAEYEKPYKTDPETYEQRFSHFQKSLRKIETLNKQRIANESARYGLTKYSDLSENEFLSLKLFSDLPTRSEKHQNCNYHHKHSKRSKRAATVVPDKFDWREKGVVTPVKSQGTCGACWAFSSVECAESMFAISNGTLRTFSVQEMIDCAGNSNFGCEGGDICSLLDWLLKTKTKIVPEATYPLTRTTDTCKIQKGPIAKSQSGIQVSDFTCDNYVAAEDQLLKQISTHGPVAAAVNALSWQNYLGGVIQFHCDGAFNSLNHAVQIVGYDKTAAVPYYIVRNSWGTAFGDKGYIYIGMGSNLCGIANQVSSMDVA